jgi:predicted Zn-dependent protease
MRTGLSFGVILVGLLAPWAVAQDTRFYSAEKEVALGRMLADGIVKESRLLDDPAAVDFVQKMAEQLARNAGFEGSLTLTVLDSLEAKTHSLPGGFLLIRSGLLARAETAAELAGVLAHEIAHIVRRHGTRQAARGEVTHLASVPMIFLGGRMGACSRMASEAPLAWRAAAARHEEEADLLALRYLDAAGYDPAGLVDAFDRLAGAGAAGAARPVLAVRDLAGEYSSSGRSYLATSSEFVALHERLARPSSREQVESAPSLRTAP